MAEITRKDKFGEALYEITLSESLRNILEIGSWDGTGSTKCFINALSQIGMPVQLTCIEIRKDRYDTLVQNVAHIPFVRTFHGTTVSIDCILPFEDIWESPYNNLKFFYSRDEVKEWYHRDCSLIRGSDVFCKDSNIQQWDGVLIDGSEFTAFAEYSWVHPHTKWLFLDDTHKSYKNSQVRSELLKSKQWELVLEDARVRNGFAIFKKSE